MGFANFDDMAFDVGPSGLVGDPTLTEYGIHQAGELAFFLSDPARLSPHPLPEKIFSSAFYRCIQTAEPLLIALRMRGTHKDGMALENGVGEWIRPLADGKPAASRPGPAKLLSSHFVPTLLDEHYEAVSYPSARGESEEQLVKRVEDFLAAWLPKVDAMGYRSVVLMAHAAVVILLGRVLTKDETLQVPAGCTSTSLYRRENGAGWSPVWLGRSDYLTNGSERDWQFGDPE